MGDTQVPSSSGVEELKHFSRGKQDVIAHLCVTGRFDPASLWGLESSWAGQLLFPTAAPVLPSFRPETPRRLGVFLFAFCVLEGRGWGGGVRIGSLQRLHQLRLLQKPSRGIGNVLPFLGFPTLA